MATATTSGIKIPYTGHSELFLSGFTSTGGAATPVRTQYLVVGLSTTYSFVTSTCGDVNFTKIYPLAYPAEGTLLVTAGTVDGGQGAAPPLSLEVPLESVLIPTTLEVSYIVNGDASSSGRLFPVVASSTTITVPLDRLGVFKVSAYTTATGTKYDAELSTGGTSFAVTSTGGNFTVSEISPNLFRLNPVSSGSDTIGVSANAKYGTAVIVFGSFTVTVSPNVAEAISLDYVTSTS